MHQVRQHTVLDIICSYLGIGEWKERSKCEYTKHRTIKRPKNH